MRPSLGSLLALSALLALASPSFAQPAPDLERAKASFKAGANAYAAGDYLAAIQALEDAYEISPLPAIAFSLAQAERKQYFVDEQRAHLERAVELFRRYLTEETRGARREDAQLAIKQLAPLLETKPGVPEPAPKAQARPTRLMIVSDAPGARITLDGGAAAASPLIREVAPGAHHARVQASGYVDAERDVMALSGELLLTEVRLTERPGTLFVSAPAAAEVYVDGVFVGQGGEWVTVPLAAGPHQLSVAQQGRRLARRDIVLERGKAHAEVVTLEPTTQRTLSRALVHRRWRGDWCKPGNQRFRGSLREPSRRLSARVASQERRFRKARRLQRLARGAKSLPHRRRRQRRGRFRHVHHRLVLARARSTAVARHAPARRAAAVLERDEHDPPLCLRSSRTRNQCRCFRSGEFLVGSTHA